MPRQFRKLTCCFASVLLVTSAIFSLQGCNMAPVLEESKQWRERIETDVKSLNGQMDKVALSIPGERYLRLIDATHSSDPEVRKAGQQAVRNLFNIDTEAEYEVSVWFEGPRRAEIRADIFSALTPDLRHVRAHLEGKNLNLQPVATRAVPAAEDRVRQTVTAAVNDTVNLLAEINELNDFSRLDTIKKGPRQGRKGESDERISSFLTRIREEEIQATRDRNSSLKQRAAEKWTRLMLMAFADRDLPIRDNVVRRDWAVLDGRQFLFVVVSEKDAELIRDKKVVVRASVHKKGKPSETVAQRAAYEFDPLEFPIETAIDDPIKGKLCWASHNMTGIELFSSASIKALNDFDEYYQKYLAATRPTPPKK